MKPSHLLIVGGTGSGKTSLARILVDPLPRLLVFDSSEDTIWNTVATPFTDPGRAMDFVFDHAERDYQAVLRFRREETYLPVLGALYELHRDHDLPPLVVVMEEASVWSETRDIPGELEAVATRGRKHGLVLVSIAQETTQLNPTIRRQAFLTVTLRQHTLPTDLKSQLTSSEERQVRQLATVDPYTVPRAGEHFVTIPPGTDPYRHLLLAAADRDAELPADYRPPRPS